MRRSKAAYIPPPNKMNAATAASGSSSSSPSHSHGIPLLVLGAIGVVFGDIGTSPLYALKEAFSPKYGIPLTEANVFGILSVMVWSMVWVSVVFIGQV